MKRVKVNGREFVASRLGPSDIGVGTLVSGVEFRRAARVVAIDGGDAILRNLRYPDLLEAVPADEMAGLFWKIEPAAEPGGGAEGDGAL